MITRFSFSLKFISFCLFPVPDKRFCICHYSLIHFNKTFIFLIFLFFMYLYCYKLSHPYRLQKLALFLYRFFHMGQNGRSGESPTSQKFAHFPRHHLVKNFPTTKFLIPPPLMGQIFPHHLMLFGKLCYIGLYKTLQFSQAVNEKFARSWFKYVLSNAINAISS